MSGIIREFLVSLGFRIDEQQMRRFQDGITGSTAAVSSLGRSALDTALQVVDAVEKMAKQYESLHYASQRTHATVGNLKAIAYASSQIGMSAEEGAAAVEGFANALRTPGKAEWLKSMGVTAKDAAEGVGQLMKYLKKTYGDGSMETQKLAENIAGGAGINPDTFLQIWNNSDEFFKYFDEYNASLKNAGLNTKKVADNSTELERALRSLESHLDMAKVKLLEGLVGPTTEAVKWFDELIKRFEKVGGYLDKIIAITHGDTALLKEGVEYALPQAGNDYLQKLNTEPRRPSAAFYDKWRQSHPRAPDASGDAESSIRVPSTFSLSGGGVSAPTDPKARRRFVADFYMREGGFTPEQAWAMAGNLNGETVNFNPAQEGGWIRGRDGRLHKEDSYGAGQWHKERRDDFKGWSGHEMRGTDLIEQMRFSLYEMTQGKYRMVGEHLKAAKTVRDAVGVLVSEYEHPADIPGNIRSRGDVADRWFQEYRLGAARGGDMQAPLSAPDAAGGPASNAINQTNHFTVNATGDAHNIKSAVVDAMRTATGYMYVELDRHR